MNYLALIGWSPGDDDELLPVDELARRFSLERVGPQRRRVRRGEAGVGEPALSEDGRSAAARRAVAAVSSTQAGVAMTPDRARPGVPRVGDADGDARRSIGSIRCRRGWRSCSTTTPTRRSRDPRRARRDARRRRARGGRARWPRSWRARRGSIASGSARVANAGEGADRAERARRCSIRSASR